MKAQPLIIGEIHAIDRFGNKRTPEGRIIFVTRDNGTGLQEGAAVSVFPDDIHGDETLPLHDSRGGRIVIPGYTGLSCIYDSRTGTFKDFSEYADS